MSTNELGMTFSVYCMFHKSIHNNTCTVASAKRVEQLSTTAKTFRIDSAELNVHLDSARILSPCTNDRFNCES